MRIWVKPDRLAHLGITIGDIGKAMSEQNIIVPGGKFGAEPAPEGTEFTYTVRMPDRLQTAEEFGNIIVRTILMVPRYVFLMSPGLNLGWRLTWHIPGSIKRKLPS